MSVIIFPNGSGGIGVVHPTGEIPVIQTALSCVPYGLPFKIISSIPDDRVFRATWEADFSQPDGFGANYGTGSDYGVYARDKAGNARLVALPAKDQNGEEIEFRKPRQISTAAVRAETASVTVSDSIIMINIGQARDVAHSIRRQKRSAEFAPLDEVIAKQIPGTDMSGAELAREAVREKYVVMQTAIDEAKSVDQLHEIIK